MQVLGDGAHASVVSGTFGNYPVAIKLLRSDDPHAGFEIKALGVLATAPHQHVVRALPPVKLPSGELALPMQRFYGGDLFSLIETTGGLSEASAASALHQLVSAVRHCHSLGIAHGDIKPENVLVERTDDGRANLALTDFGNAVTMPRHQDSVATAADVDVDVDADADSDSDSDAGSPLSSHVLRVGTPGYASPEAIAHHGRSVPSDLHLASDVWALGVTLYAMLTASAPWEQASPDDEDFYEYTMSGELPVPEGVHLSDDVAHLLKQMLDPNADTRIHLASLVHHPWVVSSGAAPAPAPAPASAPAAVPVLSLPAPGPAARTSLSLPSSAHASAPKAKPAPAPLPSVPARAPARREETVIPSRPRHAASSKLAPDVCRPQ